MYHLWFSDISTVLLVAQSTTAMSFEGLTKCNGLRGVEGRADSSSRYGNSGLDIAFVVEVDASSVALGALIAQKGKHAKTSTVQFGFEVITEAKKSYAAFKTIVMAIILALE